MMHNPSMSLAGQTKAAMIHIERTQELREANRQALGSRVAGWVDKLSPRTKEFLQASLAKPSAGSSTASSASHPRGEQTPRRRPHDHGLRCGL